MTTPRTVSGQAALSGMRPHRRRAFGATIMQIEAEARAPFESALRDAQDVLVAVAAGPDRDLAARAESVRRRLAALVRDDPDGVRGDRGHR
jgi:hypothetical protein